MQRRSKRILWLLNHTTLRKCEVPLLQDLGYEVFVPKKVLPNVNVADTWSADFTDDKYLTIPAELIEKLNKHSFYLEPWETELADEINKYFGTAICACIPSLIVNTVNGFTGKILFRAFGLEGKRRYADLILNECGVSIAEKIKTEKKRIWFAQSCDNIAKNEPEWLSKITVTLPLGLPMEINACSDTWQGGIAKILFICPRIKTINYYRQVYNNFKQNFGDLPHSIAGAQPIPVADENVVGFVDDITYKEMLQNYQVMFYHSTEERHLHYHPLEAIAYGMPIIFMAGGMLSQLAGIDLPGSCRDFQEARKKILRVLDGEQAFINELKSTQKLILQKFLPEYIREKWNSEFAENIWGESHE